MSIGTAKEPETVGLGPKGGRPALGRLLTQRLNRRLRRWRRAKALQREQRKNERLCVECGLVPPRPDRTTCADCAPGLNRRSRKNKKRKYLALKALRICVHCEDREPMKGVLICGVCSEAQVERQHERRAERREEGKCPLCGKDRDREDRANCTPCRLAQNAHSAKSKAKAREKKKPGQVLVPVAA